MKHISKIHQALLALTALVAVTACSDDWDDHYKAGNIMGGNSLWTTIEANPDLSNFASVARAAGYDKTLGSSQAFTVFAPVNADFSADEAQALIQTYNAEKAANTRDRDNTTIKEFLQNHIALYDHSVATSGSDSVVMLNGKYQMLTPSTFAGQSLLSSNQACANGVLFTVAGRATFAPNVFEYLSKDADLDSVAAFLNSFNEYEFDASSSVPGDINENGQTEYLDSVVNLENDELFENLGRINSEDSSFWMLAPTNEVWNQYVPQFEKYFVYDNTVGKRDSIQWANARFALLKGIVFSRTKNTDASLQDSAMSTLAVSYSNRYRAYGSYDDKYYQYDHPYGEGGIFTGTTNEECSNGQVMKVPDWKILPTQTFLQTIRVEGENGDRDSVDTESTNMPVTYTVQSNSPYYSQVSNHSYVQISPSGRSNQATAYFSIPNLLSNVPYDIIIRTAPALAGDTLSTDDERLPCRFRVRLRYQNADGTKVETARLWQTIASNVYTTQDSVDTFTFTCVNEKASDLITIPYTTYDPSDDGRLGLTTKAELVIDTRASSTQVNRHQYNRILRIDEIIFRPHVEE